MPIDYYAHIRRNVDGTIKRQTGEEHCRHTAEIASELLEPIGAGKAAYLTGYLHDMGKCKQEYQEYLDINAYDVAIYPDENRFRKFRGYDFGDEVLLLARAKNLVAPKHYVFMNINGRTEFAYQFFSSVSDSDISFCFVNSGGAHLQMITSGLAQGFVPEEMRDLHKDDSILLFPAPNDKYVRKMKICFKRERRLSPMAASFCAFAKDYFHLSNTDQIKEP